MTCKNVIADITTPTQGNIIAFDFRKKSVNSWYSFSLIFQAGNYEKTLSVAKYFSVKRLLRQQSYRNITERLFQ